MSNRTVIQTLFIDVGPNVKGCANETLIFKLCGTDISIAFTKRLGELGNIVVGDR
ncbi:MAG: hypothetical protein O7G31_09245 [Calditrichaeota bacterium]|nr:hypothetical protein [Calditrichota bacterium]